jgi:ferredoxin-type protein NapH
MKYVKLTGLVLFIVGFLIFNFSFFLASYRLSPQIIEDHISDTNKSDLFKKEAATFLDKEITSNFEFVKLLAATFEKVNNEQLNAYAITTNEVEKLHQQSAEVFTKEVIEQLFTGEDAINKFKQKAFEEYGAWLFGQKASIEQLEAISNSIKNYGIINQFGFDRYQMKDLTYSFTRASAQSPVKNNPTLYIILSYGLCILGAFAYILPRWKTEQGGIKNNNIYYNVMKNGGWLGILTGSWLIAFYILLYFYPEYMTNWVIMVDPISKLLNGGEAGRFFLYGFIYTLSILVMGVRMLLNYRHSKYQMIRTFSVMFFQTAFAFLIPEILIRLNKPYFDFKNIWPLDYSFFFDSRLNELIASGTLGIFMLGWGLALIIIAVPVFVYFFGKRWYCSWICGCGGLAETLGDPYRQLSNKTLKAWKAERWMVHGVLVFAVVMTAGVLYTYWSDSSWFIFVDSYKLREIYGAFIGAGFAGVVGTGFYPFMGNRVWCRFGCPLAAYLGLIQRFKSRFRITTNGGQCISCGNCSTYCEMGIDVRWYAQRGQNIVRASCVGCGVCSSVCPRGVLNLENRVEDGRFGKPILIGNNRIEIVD